MSQGINTAMCQQLLVSAPAFFFGLFNAWAASDGYGGILYVSYIVYTYAQVEEFDQR